MHIYVDELFKLIVTGKIIDQIKIFTLSDKINQNKINRNRHMQNMIKKLTHKKQQKPTKLAQKYGTVHIFLIINFVYLQLYNYLVLLNNSFSFYVKYLSPPCIQI